jgi:hypothetical protein
LNTAIKNRLALAQTVEYQKYEVDSKRCDLEISDPVTPETIIGWHYASGQPVRAGLFGHIATIYFNPMHDSLLILAVSGGNNWEETQHFQETLALKPDKKYS